MNNKEEYVALLKELLEHENEKKIRDARKDFFQ